MRPSPTSCSRLALFRSTRCLSRLHPSFTPSATDFALRLISAVVSAVFSRTSSELGLWSFALHPIKLTPDARRHITTKPNHGMENLPGSETRESSVEFDGLRRI